MTADQSGLSVACLVGQHAWPPTFELRPPKVVPALGISWLRWERHCTRCRHGVERRWFQVRTVALRGRKPIGVRAYLALLHQDPPDPATLSTKRPAELPELVLP